MIRERQQFQTPVDELLHQHLTLKAEDSEQSNLCG